MGDTATELVHEGIDLSDEGAYEAAVRVLTRAIEVDPANAQARRRRSVGALGAPRDRVPHRPRRLTWRAS